MTTEETAIAVWLRGMSTHASFLSDAGRSLVRDLAYAIENGCPALDDARAALARTAPTKASVPDAFDEVEEWRDFVTWTTQGSAAITDPRWLAWKARARKGGAS